MMAPIVAPSAELKLLAVEMTPKTRPTTATMNLPCSKVQPQQQKDVTHILMIYLSKEVFTMYFGDLAELGIYLGLEKKCGSANYRGTLPDDKQMA
jgi:hypothetical protein